MLWCGIYIFFPVHVWVNHHCAETKISMPGIIYGWVEYKAMKTLIEEFRIGVVYGLSHCVYLTVGWPIYTAADIDGLVQGRRNSSALAMGLRLSCTNPSIYCTLGHFHDLSYKTGHNIMCENGQNTTHTENDHTIPLCTRVVKKPSGALNLSITMFKISIRWPYSNTFWATIFKHFGHISQLQL